MSTRRKVGRNDRCPCGSVSKYKFRCEGKVDWNKIIRAGGDWRSNLSIRGRNIQFIHRVLEILELEAGTIQNLADYKARFTSKAVRGIYEAVLDSWPPDSDIASILEAASADVSGHYIGDYDLGFISRGIVRHSIYANKLLIVDPFIYPTSVRDEYNPLIEPAQHRAQTLKNVNFWLSLFPWIEAGIIEIIRTPADFDRKLNWDSLKNQKRKFDTSAELTEALEVSVNELRKRHSSKEVLHRSILGPPDSYLKNMAKRARLEEKGYNVEEFLDYVRELRESDPDFLETLDLSGSSGQLHMVTSGASYDIAQLTAGFTRSYLITDLHVKWKEIELDRQSHNVENRV